MQGLPTLEMSHVGKQPPQLSNAPSSDFQSLSSRKMGLVNKNFSVLQNYYNRSKPSNINIGRPAQTLTYGFASSDETIEVLNTSQMSGDRLITVREG